MCRFICDFAHLCFASHSKTNTITLTKIIVDIVSCSTIKLALQFNLKRRKLLCNVAGCTQIGATSYSYCPPLIPIRAQLRSDITRFPHIVTRPCAMDFISHRSLLASNNEMSCLKLKKKKKKTNVISARSKVQGVSYSILFFGPMRRSMSFPRTAPAKGDRISQMPLGRRKRKKYSCHVVWAIC